jgi:hypothetical protein
VLEHRHAVRPLDRGEAMCDHHAGPAGKELIHRILEQVLGPGVDARRSFVEHEDGRIIQERPSDGKKLPLSVGEIGAAFEQ